MVLDAEGISKIYRQGGAKVPAILDADISIGGSERILVKGPSGAGKSTLLHVLGGLDVPSSGRVKFKGKDIYKAFDATRCRIRNRSFGFVFQFYHLLPELNVLENVMMPARIMGGMALRKARGRAMMLVEKVGMQNRIKHRPSQLSGGEAQRTAVARALINSPEILFCDEPTGNLDSHMSEQIHQLIHRLSLEENMAVMVVSHQNLDGCLFDSEYYMKDGALTRVGGPNRKESHGQKSFSER